MKKIKFTLLTSALVLSSCTNTYVISSAGESLSALTKVTDAEKQCISPYGGDEGKDLFYSMEEKGGVFNIYRKENPFSNATTQKTSGRNDNCSPTYNAVIDRIAFSGRLEGASTSDIYMMDNNKGKTLTQITESTDAYEDNPCFSPDGKYLVFEKNRSRIIKALFMKAVFIQSHEIWLKNLTTGETSLLTNGAQPAFSPDGSKIVFVKYASDAKSCSIWMMDIDGGNQMQLTDAKKGLAFHPRFSPDGTKIVFDASKEGKKDQDIYIISIDGNNLVQITSNKSYDGQPYWTTDGYIYFVSDRGGKAGNRQIWRFKLGSSSSPRTTQTTYVQPIVSSPTNTQSQPTTQSQPVTSQQASLIYHEVKPGETLSQIAQTYGISIGDIIRWNKLTSTTVPAGTKLKLQIK